MREEGEKRFPWGGCIWRGDGADYKSHLLAHPRRRSNVTCSKESGGGPQQCLWRTHSSIHEPESALNICVAQSILQGTSHQRLPVFPPWATPGRGQPQTPDHSGWRAWTRDKTPHSPQNLHWGWESGELETSPTTEITINILESTFSYMELRLCFMM